MARLRDSSGRFAPVLTNVAEAAQLVSSGAITATYAKRIVGAATRKGIESLTPEARRVARGHEYSASTRAQKLAEISVQYRGGATYGPITRATAARQLLHDDKYRNTWEFITKPSTPGQQRYYTPSDSIFGRMAYYSKGAMARYLRDYIGYDEDEIDYILYPDEES